MPRESWWRKSAETQIMSGKSRRVRTRTGMPRSLSFLAQCPNSAESGWYLSRTALRTNWCVKDFYQLYLIFYKTPRLCEEKMLKWTVPDSAESLKLQISYLVFRKVKLRACLNFREKVENRPTLWWFLLTWLQPILTGKLDLLLLSLRVCAPISACAPSCPASNCTFHLYLPLSALLSTSVHKI